MKVSKVKGGDIEISNLSNLFERKSHRRNRHGSLLPNSIRCLVCGPSSCGKTNLVLSLLTHPNGLCFKNVYVYSKTLFQPKYEFLKELINGLDEINYFPFRESEEIMCPTEANPYSVFIFDDVSLKRGVSKIRDYFSLGRHAAVDSFFLCQTYSSIPKQLIRDNANLIILFKQDGTNLKHVYFDHVHPDMTFNQFCTLCKECWKEKYGFLVISKDDTIKGGRYRKGFNYHIQL